MAKCKVGRDKFLYYYLRLINRDSLFPNGQALGVSGQRNNCLLVGTFQIYVFCLDQLEGSTIIIKAISMLKMFKQCFITMQKTPNSVSANLSLCPYNLQSWHGFIFFPNVREQSEFQKSKHLITGVFKFLFQISSWFFYADWRSWSPAAY